MPTVVPCPLVALTGSTHTRTRCRRNPPARWAARCSRRHLMACHRHELLRAFCRPAVAAKGATFSEALARKRPNASTGSAATSCRRSCCGTSGVFFIHDAWDLCFEAQCRLLRRDAFGSACSRLQALLCKAVPARARLQIAEQIWVEVCLRYSSDAVLAALRGQEDMQWQLARRLQEAVGFCLGGSHSGGRVPHQTILDELGEAFGAAFEASRGPRPCCFSLRPQPILARTPVPLLKERQSFQPRCWARS